MPLQPLFPMTSGEEGDYKQREISRMTGIHKTLDGMIRVLPCVSETGKVDMQEDSFISILDFIIILPQRGDVTQLFQVVLVRFLEISVLSGCGKLKEIHLRSGVNTNIHYVFTLFLTPDHFSL